MAMTYDSLVTAILAYAQRNDPETIAMVPTFIMLAEQRIAKDCETLGLVQYVTGSFTVNNPEVMPKPGRWRRTITFNYGVGALNNKRTQLFLREYEFCRLYSPDATVVYPEVDLPKYYSDYGFTHWLVAPTPAEAYPFEIAYLELPQPITEANQTNWLTDYASDVLFGACMVEINFFLQNTEKKDFWEGYYQIRKDSLNLQNAKRLHDRQSNVGAN